jgi:AraC-like DNA-binding protein/mannose-6-phosphate isomerase-like protein (cupin superfamily)
MKDIHHSYQTRQQMLTKDYEIFHYSDKEIERVNLHHHDFYECYLFISGDVTYLTEGKIYSLKPGDIILINSTELHQAIINTHNVPYDRIVLWIDKTFLKSLSTDATNLARCFEDPEKETVIRADFEIQQNIKTILNRILSIENYKGIGSDLLYKVYIIDLLVHLNMLLFQNSIKLDVDIKKNNLIDGIIQYINNHSEDEITIDKLSEQFYLSKYHLLREFKKHSGTTIHKYIVQKKLIQAKELILQGNPIIIVYEQCGFGDYSNFFRAFKNEYGVTPKHFYELMRKNNFVNETLHSNKD